MGLRESFFAAAGEPARAEHELPDGTKVFVGEVGTDEWLEIEAETLEWRERNGKQLDPFLDARLVVRSVTDAANLLIFKRFTPTGDADKDKAALAAYEAELQKIMKTPRRLGVPLLRKVNEVNFASAAQLEALKKKSASETSAGSSNCATAPASSIFTPPPGKSAA